MAINVTTVLLLEDEPLIAMDLEMVFQAEGYRVLTVMSCAEASSWLDRNRADFVLVDVELSDGTCTEVVGRLIDENIPFVVYSGDHPSFHVGTPFAKGTWIGKPAMPSELISAVKAATVQRQLAVAAPDCPSSEWRLLEFRS